MFLKKIIFNNFFRISSILLLVLLFQNLIFHTDVKSQTKEKQEKALQDLREEIQKAQQQLDQLKQRETSNLDQLVQIDKQKNLLQRLIRQLKSQENRLRQNIFKTRSELIELVKELNIQKKVYAKRLRHFYKHKNLGDIEILFSANSVNQAMVWLKYKRRIAQADQRRLQNLINTQDKYEEVNKKSSTERAKLSALVKEKTKEESRLNRRRNEKEGVLRKIRDDKETYAETIAEKEREYIKIRKLMRESITGRINPTIDLNKPSEFPRYKGKVIWPVKGRIIGRFGKVKSPVHESFDDFNYGIEIKAPLGKEVYATCSGVVTKKEWQRYWGLIVIINHYDGYTTFYGHLSEVDVSVGEEVYSGKIIGRVGDSGSVTTPMLHFGIWRNAEAVDPEKWLLKNPR